MIQRVFIAKTLPPDFGHLVTGTGATKTIHIDGELITVDMLRARVLEEEEAMTDSAGASLLSFAWIFWFGGLDLHDWVFRREIEAPRPLTLPIGTRAAVWLKIDSRVEPSLQKIFSEAYGADISYTGVRESLC